jgi:SNF2 family DNA or RNA helicase
MLKRAQIVRSFNAQRVEVDNKGTLEYENPTAAKARVLIANMDLLATGYNIQRANNICIFDIPWTSDKVDQTIGRGYRSGQTRNTHVKTLIAIGNGIERKIYEAFKLHRDVTELSFSITNREKEAIEERDTRVKQRLERQQMLLDAA